MNMFLFIQLFNCYTCHDQIKINKTRYSYKNKVIKWKKYNELFRNNISTFFLYTSSFYNEFKIIFNTRILTFWERKMTRNKIQYIPLSIIVTRSIIMFIEFK